MICSLCGVFIGDPCSCCRTVSRLSFLLQTGRIQPRDEGAALAALRSAAGVLSDLAERPGSVGGPLATFGARSSRVAEGEAGVLLVSAADIREAEAPVEAKDSNKEKTKDKKAKKDKSKKEKKSIREEPTPEKKEENREATAPEKEEVVEAVEETPEGNPASGSGAAAPEAERSAHEDTVVPVEITEPVPEDCLGRSVNRDVEARPHRYGLHSWPSRERREDEVEDEEHTGEAVEDRRPPEPAGPPPAHREERAASQCTRELV